MRRKSKKLAATTKKILMMAAGGAFIAGSLIMPGLPKILMGRKLNFENFIEENEWEPFDARRLRRRIKELQKNKMVQVYQTTEGFFVKVTKKGKQKLLKYKLDDLRIETPKKWDGKWRLVAYDIPTDKGGKRNAIRSCLKEIGFYQIQKSVYLYPYDCEEMIEYLRQIYNIEEYVSLLVVGSLEQEEAYKEYFDL